jgi:hypothetical protein
LLVSIEVDATDLSGVSGCQRETGATADNTSGLVVIPFESLPESNSLGGSTFAARDGSPTSW